MSFSFFIYTILIMGIALVTSSVALVVWLMTRRRDAIISAIGFLAYMLDLSVIFFDEYSRMKYDYAVSFEMPLQHPGTRCFLGIVIIGCFLPGRSCACATSSRSSRWQSCSFRSR